MLDLPYPADRPARRTALIAQELSRYNVDIAALSETRLLAEGSLTEDQGGIPSFGKDTHLIAVEVSTVLALQ